MRPALSRRSVLGWLSSLFLLASLWLNPAWAQIRAVQISTAHDVYELGTSLSYMEDPNQNLSFYDILWGRVTPDWQTSNSRIPNFGYTNSTYWFAIDLHNIDDSKSDWYLEIAYPVLDEIDIYVTEGIHVLQEYRTGDSYSFNSRIIANRNFVLPLQLEPKQQLRLYFRVKTGSSMQVPVYLWNPTAFNMNDHLVTLGQGIYYGFMIVMALYNLFLFFSIRRRNYLLYVLFIISFCTFQFCISGYAFQHLWPEHVVLNDKALPFALASTQFFMSLFIRDFLKLSTCNRGGYYFLSGTALLAFGVAVGSFFFNYKILIHTLIVMAIPINGSALLFGIQRSMAHDRAAQYFTLAWSATLVGAIVLTLNKINMMPRNFFTENALQIGTAIEVVLISFALGEYINQQRKARFRAQQESLRMEQVARLAQEEALEAQKKYSARLEEQVSERTEELKTALAQLEDANRRLERQSHIDELTNVYNRRYFNEKFDAEFRRACRDQTPLTLMMFDIDFFKKLNDNHGHLTGDHCLQMVAKTLESTMHRPADTLARYGGEEFVALLPNTPLEGAMTVAERCRMAVERLRLEYHGLGLQVTVSVGVSSLTPDHNMTPDRLILAADEALYQAKEGGRNQVRSGT